MKGRKRKGPRSQLLEATRLAAKTGNTVRLYRSALQTWLIVRGELCAVRQREETELIDDLDLRAEVYGELLTLGPALFRTRGELAAARSTLRAEGWPDYLLPDARVQDTASLPLNRADRRRRAKVATRG